MQFCRIGIFHLPREFIGVSRDFVIYEDRVLILRTFPPTAIMFLYHLEKIYQFLPKKYLNQV